VGPGIGDAKRESAGTTLTIFRMLRPFSARSPDGTQVLVATNTGPDGNGANRNAAGGHGAGEGFREHVVMVESCSEHGVSLHADEHESREGCNS
jgi:hypothetical protein